MDIRQNNANGFRDRAYASQPAPQYNRAAQPRVYAPPQQQAATPAKLGVYLPPTKVSATTAAAPVVTPQPVVRPAIAPAQPSYVQQRPSAPAPAAPASVPTGSPAIPAAFRQANEYYDEQPHQRDQSRVEQIRESLAHSLKNGADALRRIQLPLPGKLKRNHAATVLGLGVIVLAFGIGVTFAGMKVAGKTDVAQSLATQLAKADSLNASAQAEAAAEPTSTAPSGDAALMPKTAKKAPADAPATAPVSAADIAAFKVAADEPRTITIPRLNISARVQHATVTASGALATPANVFDTAWYTGSAKPGQPGATLIEGFTSSWTTHGIFYALKDVVAGDVIQVQKGDGSTVTYKVAKTNVFAADAVDMTSLSAPAQGTTGLNLVTCGGKYDTTTGESTQRVAVYAVLQS